MRIKKETACCKYTNVILILILIFLEQYHEILEVSCSKMTLQFTLCGEGIEPLVTCTHEGRIMDFGYVLEKQITSQVLTVTLQTSFFGGSCKVNKFKHFHPSKPDQLLAKGKAVSFTAASISI